MPVEQQRGKLEAERLAGARGHDGDEVAALEHGQGGFALARPEGLQAETLVQRALEGGARISSGRGAKGGHPRNLSPSPAGRGAKPRETVPRPIGSRLLALEHLPEPIDQLLHAERLLQERRAG